MYTRFLGNSFSAPTTIRNYLSGAKTWIDHHLGDTKAFTAAEPSDVLKRVSTSLNHTTIRAYPLTPEDIKTICQFMDARRDIPPAFKACMLLAYASFLRSSNLLCPTTSGWTGPHTLRTCDIIEVQDGLCIVIRSTKTRATNNPAVIKIDSAAASAICPVLAWKNYKANINPYIYGPAFVTNDDIPLTPRPMVALMRLALASVGHPHATRISMHSLRRGGVQCAAKAGASNQQLMSHGTWSSERGLKPYLTEDQRIISRVIAKSLA